MRITRLLLLCALTACGSVTAPTTFDAPSSAIDAKPAADAPPAMVTLTVTRSGAGTGTVASSPAGINCGSACSVSIAAGTSVTLTATPDGSSDFAAWTGGGCTGTGTCVVVVNSDTSIDAAFAKKQFTLTLSPTGNGTGRVTSVPAGIDCGGTCSSKYDIGTTVTLTATADNTATFLGWTGGGCTGTGTCVVTLSADTTVQASFALNNSLVVTRAGTGTGTVTSSPAGISCGTTCTAAYSPGTVVTLTAAPDPQNTFAGWTGGGCTGTGTCVVTVNAATMVTATFNLKQYTLTATKSGNGAGSVTSVPAGINCGGTCSSLFAYGSMVTLTATPSMGSNFTGWSGGGCGGTGTCTVTISAATSVQASFTLIQYTLTVTESGVSGAGTVTSNIGGINCGASCMATFNYGTTVSLSQQSVAGYTFGGWTGAGCSGRVGPCSVTITGNTTVDAQFRRLRIAINQPTNCEPGATNSIAVLKNLLTSRGHAVTIVVGTDINTGPTIGAYDVIVLNGPGNCGTDSSAYDAVVSNYVNGGGGIVASGWMLFSTYLSMSPNLQAVLPSTAANNYLTGASPITPVAGASPITAGLGAFTAQQYVPWGSGPKSGATVLMTSGTTNVGEAWTVGNGRTVYLGPMYTEDNTAYTNKDLLDGTQPNSVELMLRAVEWAGLAR